MFYFESLEPPPFLQVRGRKGSNSGMNGIYKKALRDHQGKVFYEQNGTNWVIYWHLETKSWVCYSEGISHIEKGKHVYMSHLT